MCSTYTDDWTAFQQQLSYAVSTIPPAKLVIGLETVKASNNQPYSTAELKVGGCCFRVARQVLPSLLLVVHTRTAPCF